MELIKLTDALTEKGIYVDFDKVTDIVEYEWHTIIWCHTQSIAVKETPEEIIELIKNAKEI